MKTLILFGLLLSSSAFASISIISDLDDTIKITEAGGNATDIVGSDVYLGIPDFLNGTKAYTHELYILSASPTFMGPVVKKTLAKHGVKFKSLILRKNVLEDKFSYKVRKIREIMDNSSDDFILMGDDMGKDPEVFVEIKRIYAHRILEAYIHVAKGRALPQGITTYWTSFDLFLREFTAGRMLNAPVAAFAQKILTEKDMTLVFPKLADCPKDASIWKWQSETLFQAESQEIIKKLISYCRR